MATPRGELKTLGYLPNGARFDVRVNKPEQRRGWKSNTNLNQDTLENRQARMQQQIDEDNAARADLANRQQQMQNDIAQDNAQRINNAVLNREKLYTDAVAKYAQNPSAFTQQQRDALIRVGEQLGITPEQTAANILNGGNKQNIPTAPAQQQPTTPAPTVQPTVTPSNNDVSNYGGRYGGPNEGNKTTQNTQGPNNAAGFWL